MRGVVLGAGEHALRLATDFATERRLFAGRPLLDLSAACARPGPAGVGAAAAEAVTLVAGRGFTR